MNIQIEFPSSEVHDAKRYTMALPSKKIVPNWHRRMELIKNNGRTLKMDNVLSPFIHLPVNGSSTFRHQPTKSPRVVHPGDEQFQHSDGSIDAEAQFYAGADSLDETSVDSYFDDSFENVNRAKHFKPFDRMEVEQVAKEILSEHLCDTRYEASKCREMSQYIAAKILDKIKRLQYTDVKIVSTVSIGCVTEKPGMQFGSRCLWNNETDNFANVKYSNSYLFAVAMVYGLHTD